MKKARARRIRRSIGERRGAAGSVLLLAALAVASPVWALHWPWTHRSSSGPTAVQELSIASEGGAPSAAPPILQYWDRNTLLLDLTRVGGEGAVVLTPMTPGSWPVRLEFRVRPGSVAQLEVLGTQRTVFTVPVQGGALVLKLDPGVYQADTAHVTLRWLAAGGSAR